MNELSYPTERKVMVDKAARDPTKEMNRDVFIASNPAMKNVLSNISLRKTKLKASQNEPDIASRTLFDN